MGDQGNVIRADIWYKPDDQHETRYSVAIDRNSPCPLWHIWRQVPNMMICPNNTTTPYNDLFVDLTTAESNFIRFSACPWKQEHNDVHAQLNALMAEQ